MATTTKKFLDQAGVSVLWSKVKTELDKKAAGADLTALQTSVTGLQTDVATLKGDAATEGSVAYQIAQIVANADTSFDTLKEIADWINTHADSAATMNSDIASLKTLVGSEAVATQITNAINAALKDGETNKFALAADLTVLAARVKALEDAGYQTAAQVSDAIDAKITALDLSDSYDVKGSAEAAETRAKEYADGLLANVQALTADEVNAALNTTV